MRFLIAALLFNALWVPALIVGRGMRRRMRRFVAAGGDAQRSRRIALLWSGLAALAIVPPLLLAWAWPEIADALTRNGKPLSISQGISPWPTYAIRLFTLVLCLYFVARAWLSLGDNLDKIANRFRLGHTRRELHRLLHDEESKLTLWQRMAAMLSVRFYRERAPAPETVGPMTTASINFWKHYLVQNRAQARLLRTALCVLVLTVLGWLIDRAMGEAPVAPQRGPLTGVMQLWSTLPAAVAVQFLIFFVVDATVLSVLFVRGLSWHHTSWPTRTQQLFEQQTSIPAQYLDDWIDLQFIARRTRSIGALIYYPFIVLSLMLLASSAFFDDWYNPPSLTMLAAISYTIVLGCAFALRQTAERSRRHAIDRVRDATLRAHGAGNSNLADQLALLRERMVQLRKGAFAPYSQQPLLKAVLLPILTVSGSSLFDYLSLMNL